MGALITAIGGTLLMAGLRRCVGPEVRLLGAGSALAFTAVDVIYASKRRISRIYLLDAAAELALLTGWVVAEARAARKQERQPSAARLPTEHVGASALLSDALWEDRPQP